MLDTFKKEGYVNLTFIPNTLEIDKYPFLLRKELQPKLLWVRAFDTIYNPLLAVKVIEALLEKNIDASLCMVGPEKDGALAECKEIALQKNLPITFTGMLKKKEWIALSKEYDIFINTTNFDNTPVSVMEAMALGLPVISTNVGGLPYLIEEDVNGILVSPNNINSFVEAIIDLLSDLEKSQTLAKNARVKVEGFDWEVVKEKWDEVLK